MRSRSRTCAAPRHTRKKPSAPSSAARSSRRRLCTRNKFYMEERWPWEDEASLSPADPLAHQRHEESVKEKLPRVVKLLAVQDTVMGQSSPRSEERRVGKEWRSGW